MQDVNKIILELLNNKIDKRITKFEIIEADTNAWIYQFEYRLDLNDQRTPEMIELEINLTLDVKQDGHLIKANLIDAWQWQSIYNQWAWHLSDAIDKIETKEIERLEFWNREIREIVEIVIKSDEVGYYNDTITLNLNTNLINFYSGSYETIWSDPIDEELEQEELEAGKELSDINYHSMTDVFDKYNNLDIVDQMGVIFIKKINFTGSYSPKEYNYRTDTLEFDLTIDRLELLNKLDELALDEKFEQYLREHFTSRDGFWSYTPNNYDELRDEIKYSYKKLNQSVGALISYLVGVDKLHEIELEAYYN